MKSRAGWIWVGVGALLVVLLAGRWLAVTATGGWWAQALDVADGHRGIVRLQLSLLVAGFVVTAAWCLGNLALVYRASGFMRVPRRVGDLDILEAVPHRHLLRLLVAGGLVMAAFLSRDCGNWWSARMLAAVAAGDSLKEPILGLDASYYLFQLPWERRLQEFALQAVGAVLATTVVLYWALGAIRLVRRRLILGDTVRHHVTGLLVVLALVLFWGFRLEPAEYVGGLRDVPYDAILTEIRLPTARLLGLLALVALGASVGGWWPGRMRIPLAGWIVLGLGTLLGHHVVPAFAGTVRPPARELTAAADAAARDTLTQLAFGAVREDTLAGVVAAPGRAELDIASLEPTALWDPFAVRAFLDRAVQAAPHQRFSAVHLSPHVDDKGRPAPLYVGVPVPDFSTAPAMARGLTWTDVHLGRRGTDGLFAVSAAATDLPGSLAFAPDLAQPDSLVVEARPAVLSGGEIVFAPGRTDFVILPGTATAAAHGIPLNGLPRRLALAWVLQSPPLVTATLPADAVVLWRRSVVDRLGRYAPFAEFGEPYPVVALGELYWVAPGYVAAEAYPLVPGVVWRGRRVRYLRAGFLGAVNAHTGATAVYLSSQPDQVSAAWARAIPSIVEPHASLPPFLQTQARYPEELFAVQVDLVRRASERTPGRSGAARRMHDVTEPFWWFGPGTDDAAPRLRLRVGHEDGVPSRLDYIVDGAVEDGVPILRVLRVPKAVEIPGPSEVARTLAGPMVTSAASLVAGAVRPIPMPNGILFLQPTYRESADSGARPALAEVTVRWGDVTARAATLSAALARIRAGAPTGSISAAQWEEARRWFAQMDAARRAGDWAAFDAAYERFRRALTTAGDAVP